MQRLSGFTTAIWADPGRIAVELSTGSLFGGTKIVWLNRTPLEGASGACCHCRQPIEGAYLAVQAPDMKKTHKLVQAFEAAPYLAAIASHGEDEQSLSAAIRRQVQAAGYDIAADAAALIAAAAIFPRCWLRARRKRSVATCPRPLARNFRRRCRRLPSRSANRWAFGDRR